MGYEEDSPPLGDPPSLSPDSRSKLEQTLRDIPNEEPPFSQAGRDFISYLMDGHIDEVGELQTALRA